MSDKPHYTGHRQRLKEKLLEHGHSYMKDYELLELLLMLAIPRIDVKPLSKDLLKKFGSFDKVINADENDLKQIKGIKENTIAVFKIVQGSIVRSLKSKIEKTNIINNWTKLLDYCLSNIANEPVEQFRILFLDTKFHLIKDKLMQKGTINYASVYPREIVKEVLNLNANSIIMIHNHPSGSLTPSQSDIDITNQVKNAVEAIGVNLHDHIIIGKGGKYTSFKETCLL